jgi:hypothetical protein
MQRSSVSASTPSTLQLVAILADKVRRENHAKHLSVVATRRPTDAIDRDDCARFDGAKVMPCRTSKNNRGILSTDMTRLQRR